MHCIMVTFCLLFSKKDTGTTADVELFSEFLRKKCVVIPEVLICEKIKCVTEAGKHLPYNIVWAFIQIVF